MPLQHLALTPMTKTVIVLCSYLLISFSTFSERPSMESVIAVLPPDSLEYNYTTFPQNIASGICSRRVRCDSLKFRVPLPSRNPQSITRRALHDMCGSIKTDVKFHLISDICTMQQSLAASWKSLGR